jgi:NADH dehydrogenase
MRTVPRVVIIGGGFGGLQCARKLRGEAVDVLLIDRQNYHLFTPLLYQVASCLLNPSEVAIPLRKLFRGARNVRYRQGEVVEVDLVGRKVHLADGVAVEYDYVVIATGSETNYFGNKSLEKAALSLKDLGQALRLRNHVLECLERAAVSTDAEARRRLLTFCIVGGGPTGVEYAGALSELVRLVLPKEYPEIAPAEVQIVLLEGGDRVLPMFGARLGHYAQRELARKGVDVRTHTFIASADDMGAVTRSGHEIRTETIVWTAGVLAADIPLEPNIAHNRSRRYVVDDHLRIVDAHGAYAIGDVAAAFTKRGKELSMLAPPAMQEGRYVARQILKGVSAQTNSRRRFRYFDKGTMATIGRTSGVVQIGPLRLTGFVAWVTWLVVHVYYLVGFQNRLRVLMRWAWYYIRLDRPVRAILQADDHHR